MKGKRGRGTGGVNHGIFFERGMETGRAAVGRFAVHFVIPR